MRLIPTKRRCLILLALWLSMISAATAGEIDTLSLWERYLQPQALWPERAPHARRDLAPLPPPVRSPDDPLARLGEQLFHEVGLSSDESVSCASCHLPEHQMGDARTVSEGVAGRAGRRNSPTLMNVDQWEALFWDGRVDALTELANHPLADPLELDFSPYQAARRIRRDTAYAESWPAAFGDAPVVWDRISQALAAFMETFRSEPGPLDHFLRDIEAGDFASAATRLDDQQLLGLHLFRTEAGCINCHNGSLLSDGEFHNIGLHYFARRFHDLGRYEVTGNDEDMGAFRTATLRHVSQTGPWMHNGLFPSLHGIVRMYEHGGARPRRPQDLPEGEFYPETSERLQPFDLTDEERRALLAFLELL
ncbi:MAG: cytochrome-c peroxidase [Wenzhouxiangella sp.]